MITQTELEIFYKATKSRDHRFDGRFYTAVKTTGIYCRPVCPAKPKRENIEFFKTAQAAERAGYRPCLRCRPEVAPQSPAWIGKSAVVKRAMGLISEGLLFEESEAKFASRLGMSERHLRRLFMDEIGMTAKQISDSQRLNFAKTLVAETQIPITDVAFNSGFKSIRRFNDAFSKKFSRKPSEIRKKGTIEKSKNSVTLYLRYRPPYDWNFIIGFLKSHSIPFVEDVVNDSYHRLFIDENTKKPALVVVSNKPEKNCLVLETFGVHTKSLFSIAQRVRRMFDLDSDPLLIANAFSQSKFLENIYLKSPGLRIPRGWSAFETAVATILGQLVTVEFGRRLLGQLIQECGSFAEHSFDTQLNYIFPSSEVLQTASLSNVKTTARRKETIRNLAEKLNQGELSLSETCDLAEVRSILKEIKGIGPWSVEYICLRAIGDTNAFPDKDLIINRVLERHPEVSQTDLQPWRSYLALYLWREYAKTYSKKGAKNVV